MATYNEIYELRSDSTLKNRVAVAVIKKAQSLLALATPTAAQVTWANGALNDATGKATSLINYVLAANSDSTVAQIQAATDATIQTNIDAAVDKIITGGA